MIRFLQLRLLFSWLYLGLIDFLCDPLVEKWAGGRFICSDWLYMCNSLSHNYWAILWFWRPTFGKFNFCKVWFDGFDRCKIDWALKNLYLSAFQRMDRSNEHICTCSLPAEPRNIMNGFWTFRSRIKGYLLPPRIIQGHDIHAWCKGVGCAHDRVRRGLTSYSWISSASNSCLILSDLICVADVISTLRRIARPALVFSVFLTASHVVLEIMFAKRTSHWTTEREKETYLCSQHT